MGRKFDSFFHIPASNLARSFLPTLQNQKARALSRPQQQTPARQLHGCQLSKSF